ncbi:hypothetical protein P152DRAFT_459409 [Eremomyces bilateralis CBS 781.70]|uniref:HNH nuclease domain-containing protein n=1 Tax=Eremomyces bilateralis CBS 781.70 TaxID=1392243 RepID=A0A6G1G0M1_9PEZI|nr:uncharacterized protein P152DRAFT_459409 [Eremomyces bilateralis CBS 781.70]KAF1811470.1 hypothetical protein P152DRAFT_459409 [Eremomyces bilateralis CBS 781.70]
MVQSTLPDILEGVLNALPQDPVGVLELIQFDSAAWKDELKICKFLCDDINSIGPSRANLMNALVEDHKFASGSPQEIQDWKDERIRVQQKLWLLAQSVLRDQHSRSLLDRHTFIKCRNRILRNLWRLHCHRRALANKNRTEGRMGNALLTAYSYPTASNTLDHGVTKKSGRKTRPGQATFSIDVSQFYACRNEDKYWCPVTQHWLPRKSVTAAHIVPYSFGEKNFKAVFGKATKMSLMDVTNGLFLHRDVEQAFDRKELVIVPLYQGCQPTIFRACVLDPKKLEGTNDERTYGSGTYRWADIDGKELKFQNDNRPARRFLYLHILLTLITRSIHETEDWAFRLSSLAVTGVQLTDDQSMSTAVFWDLVNFIADPAVVFVAKDIIHTLSHQTWDIHAEVSADMMGWVANFEFSSDSDDGTSAEEWN